MKALSLLALLAAGAVPVDHPRTYLLSIGQVPLKDTEAIDAFAIRTWGVRFDAVCRIPPGWRIRAGGSATPEGVLEGEGGQGATWFGRASPAALRAFVLVTLYGPVQRRRIGSPDNGMPPTFAGRATIATDDGDVRRRLTYRNITLTPARRCPR